MAGRVLPNIVTDGLILYFDAANTKSYISGSTTWNDISITNANGNLFNGPTFNSSNGGNISFDGIDDYFINNFSSVSSITQSTSALTLSVFFKGNFTGEFRDVVGVNKSSGQNPFAIRINSSNNIFYDTTVGGTRYTPSFANGTYTSGVWYHACATFGNNTIITYLNGRSVNQQATSGPLQSFTSTEFGVAAIGYGFFKGNVSNIQYYNRALSQNEILENYNALKGRYGL